MGKGANEQKRKWQFADSHIFKFAIFLICCLTLSACLPTAPPPAPPTQTPTPTLTGTPTTVWFPPTATPTPIPTQAASPTVELLPDIGEIFLEDDFSLADPWLTGNMGNGVIALGNHELSLALTQPRGYLFTFRDAPTFDNFYAEITASPNLCTGEDEYGMLIRYNSASDFYRFSLSCNGQVRLDKLVGGTASSPQPWLVSASVPTAAPSQSRLGVWVSGRHFRFFINDEFQFSISDRVLSRGLIGVFARSAGETAVTVHFSDLVVHQIGE